MAPLQNIYYERKVATGRPCFVCRGSTTTVLATIDTKDFVYTCEKHLSDPGFATLIPQPEAPSGPSKEDIAKVVQEYKDKEARKSEKEKEKKEGNKEEDKSDKKETSIPSYGSPSTMGIPSSSAPPPSKHRQFALHRGIFAIRERELKSKEQGAKAREIGKGLPQVPRGQI